MNYRIVIGGCRDYTNYSVFKTFVDICLSNIKQGNNITIVSGHCSGVDTMAERYAKEKNYKLEIYPAKWKLYGKSAGPKRNAEMIEVSDFVIAFWDKHSKGTKNLIKLAISSNKPIRVKYITL